MLELKTIGHMAGVELLEHYRSLYEKGKVGAKIGDNQLHGRDGTAGASPILVRRK